MTYPPNYLRESFHWEKVENFPAVLVPYSVENFEQKLFGSLNYPLIHGRKNED